MGNIMKVGGKSPNNTAVGMSVDNNGMVNTHHVWEGGFITAMNLEIRDTDAHVSELFDISEYSIVSLRVLNTCDQTVAIRFYGDKSENAYLSTMDGEITILVDGKNREQIITPDDLPCLPYLNKIKLRVSCETAPTSGGLAIYIAHKR